MSYANFADKAQRCTKTSERLYTQIRLFSQLFLLDLPFIAVKPFSLWSIPFSKVQLRNRDAVELVF
jgi:hypothetical protein